MFCNKCGKEVPNGSSFCPYCGNKIDESIKEKVNVVTEKVTVEVGEATPARSKAMSLTIMTGIVGILILLMSLLFGMSYPLIILAVVFIIFLIMRSVAYKNVEITQKDIDAFTDHYRQKIDGFDEKPEGFKQRYTFQSPQAVTGFNKLNVYLTTRNKKGEFLLGTFAYIFSMVGLIFGIVGVVSGFSGFAMNIDGTYIQSTAPAQGNGSIQVGKTAYKVEGDKIYYAGYYEGDNTAWSGPYNYHRLGNKVTYKFTGGGMNRDMTLYFTNFGNNISEDRFGFSVVYKRGK